MVEQRFVGEDVRAGQAIGVVDDPELARRDLGSLADLVEKVAIARLVRPRRFDLLPATAQLVAEAVSSAATSKEQS